MINEAKLKNKTKSYLLTQKDISRMANIENTKFHRWLNSDKKLPEEDLVKIKNAIEKLKR